MEHMYHCHSIDYFLKWCFFICVCFLKLQCIEFGQEARTQWHTVKKKFSILDVMFLGLQYTHLFV